MTFRGQRDPLLVYAHFTRTIPGNSNVILPVWNSKQAAYHSPKKVENNTIQPLSFDVNNAFIRFTEWTPKTPSDCFSFHYFLVNKRIEEIFSPLPSKKILNNVIITCFISFESNLDEIIVNSVRKYWGIRAL